MELEDLYLPCATICFIAGFSLLLLLAIPETYFFLHLGFQHFCASLIMIALSGVLALLYCLANWGWGLSEYEIYYNREEAVRIDRALESPTVISETRTLEGSGSNSKDAPCDPPTREELQRLKQALGIEEGSLQFKRKGAGIYQVIYQNGKHIWNHLGSWTQLKEKIS